MNVDLGEDTICAWGRQQGQASDAAWSHPMESPRRSSLWKEWQEKGLLPTPAILSLVLFYVFDNDLDKDLKGMEGICLFPSLPDIWTSLSWLQNCLPNKKWWEAELTSTNRPRSYQTLALPAFLAARVCVCRWPRPGHSVSHTFTFEPEDEGLEKWPEQIPLVAGDGLRQQLRISHQHCHMVPTVQAEQARYEVQWHPPSWDL